MSLRSSLDTYTVLKFACVSISGHAYWSYASSSLRRLTCNGFHFPTWEVADEHGEGETNVKSQVYIIRTQRRNTVCTDVTASPSLWRWLDTPS